jgi:hypothetical protein
LGKSKAIIQQIQDMLGKMIITQEYIHKSTLPNEKPKMLKKIMAP